MIYPEDFEARLGFDRVRALIESRLSTRLAREKLAETGFSSDFETVVRRLGEVDEMRVILLMEQDFPVGGYVDIVYLVSKIRIEGAYLEAEEIVSIAKALHTAGKQVAFFARKEERQYPFLKSRAAGVSALPAIQERIVCLVDRFGRVRDDASPELSDIRRSLREKEQQVGKRLQAILRAARSEGIIDEDAAVSIRDGRAVIPVPSTNKRKLKGFVHDESATGKTFYVEPEEVVELNNEIKELEYAEKREIIRILVAFADFLRPYSEELIGAGDFLAFMELTESKARVAIDMRASKPVLRKEAYLDLRQARHPLLEQTLVREGKRIVPLNLTLSREKHILVISGANAGGKSVCLKTVGLLQYMLQCGLLIPAGENSETGLFRSIFIDIGDQQSLDNDLSTYSSHLQNMKTMLRYSDDRSLILIDEFGSGTEPVMGGAIAETLLERFEARGVFGVITTHYSNLKYYAGNAKGVLNGAMTFDIRNIRPLFGLEIGKPGSSFALEIARKIGLPEDVVRAAQDKIGSEQVNIEKQLRDIARDKRYWETKRENIRLAGKRAEELAVRYEKELTEILRQRKELLAAARQEAKQIVNEANRRVENTVREIREAQAEKERTKLIRQELEQFRRETENEETVLEEDARLLRKMEKLREKERRREERSRQAGNAENKPETPAAVPIEKKTFEPGDKVRIKGQVVAGEITRVEGSRCYVAFGHLISQVEAKRLEPISAAEYKRQQKENANARSSGTAFPGGMGAETKTYDVSEKRLNFKNEIDLRGARVDEALARVQVLVDEAYMLGIADLRILHGKGTGALKEEIRRYLRTVPFVADCRDEHVQFGGAGITLVRLDI